MRFGFCYTLYMPKSQNIALLFLRLTLGSLFLYAGITKLIDPAWTSAGYLMGAKTMAGFYHWLASSQMIASVDGINKWGLLLIGSALILGLATRVASFLAIVLMALYYIPTFSFPYAGAHAYIVDEHIIYIAALCVLIVFRAGTFWGIDGAFDQLREAPAKIKNYLKSN